MVYRATEACRTEQSEAQPLCTPNRHSCRKSQSTTCGAYLSHVHSPVPLFPWRVLTGTDLVSTLSCPAHLAWGSRRARHPSAAGRGRQEWAFILEAAVLGNSDEEVATLLRRAGGTVAVPPDDPFDHRAGGGRGACGLRALLRWRQAERCRHASPLSPPPLRYCLFHCPWP